MNRHYYKNYQCTHDIDWFFKYNNHYYHIASNCGLIPNNINISTNRNLQHEIANLQEITEAVLVIDNADGLDLSSFEEFARKGFISLDREDGSFEDRNYFVVAVPKNGETPPKSIIEKIPEMDIKMLGEIIHGREYI